MTFVRSPFVLDCSRKCNSPKPPYVLYRKMVRQFLCGNEKMSYVKVCSCARIVTENSASIRSLEVIPSQVLTLSSILCFPRLSVLSYFICFCFPTSYVIKIVLFHVKTCLSSPEGHHHLERGKARSYTQALL